MKVNASYTAEIMCVKCQYSLINIGPQGQPITKNQLKNNILGEGWTFLSTGDAICGKCLEVV